MTYDAADNSAKSYALAIETMREKLASQGSTVVAGTPVRFFNEPRTVALYGIRKTNSGPFVYIGSTSQLVRDRIRGHVLDAKKGGLLPINEWVRENLDGFEVVVLEVVQDFKRHEREKHWVGIHSETLLNVTDGGPGMSGHRFAGTDHARNIASSVRTGASFDCEQCGAAFWRKRTEIEKGNVRFCSRRCYSNSLKGITRKVSDICTERGVAAAAAEKLSRELCKRGHPLSGDNLFRTSNGARGCKECRRIHKAAYRGRLAHVEA